MTILTFYRTPAVRRRENIRWLGRAAFVLIGIGLIGMQFTLWNLK